MQLTSKGKAGAVLVTMKAAFFFSLKQGQECTASTAQKWSFPWGTCSVNVTKSAGNCGFGQIYWRNP